jgi:hypothetical protein
MPDEEFDVLGEDELALLTRRFKRLQENRVNKRRNTRTCFQCGKLGHFVADCPEKVENKDGYKHKSRTNGKYRSRTRMATSTSQGRMASTGREQGWIQAQVKSKNKHKHKDE